MKNIKKNHLTALLVSICAVITLLAGATGVLAANIHVTHIDIPAQTSLELGTTEALEVAYTVEGDLPENILQAAAKTAHLSWSSSDESVATVDKHSQVTTIGPGTAKIAVCGQNGTLTDICTIIVTVTPETLTTPESISLTLNHTDTQPLGAALLPENTTAKVCYKSSDETVATVSEAGEVTAIGRGECIIRAWAVDSLTGSTYDLQNETKVSVQAAPAKLSLSNVTLQPGATKQLTVSTEPAEVDVGTNFIWTSSDESIATVDDVGTVSAKAVGTVTITATNELGQTASCKVTVTGCTYCGNNSHTATYCAEKAVTQRGAMARWRIPSVGIDVAVFNCDGKALSVKKTITNASDSACFLHSGNTTIIGDHNNQGFNAIKLCEVGTVAYLDTGAGVQKYICTKKEIGSNSDYILKYADGAAVQYARRGGLICYTCNHHWTSVTIVTFQPVS